MEKWNRYYSDIHRKQVAFLCDSFTEAKNKDSIPLWNDNWIAH